MNKKLLRPFFRFSDKTVVLEVLIAQIHTKHFLIVPIYCFWFCYCVAIMFFFGQLDVRPNMYARQHTNSFLVIPFDCQKMTLATNNRLAFITLCNTSTLSYFGGDSFWEASS